MSAGQGSHTGVVCQHLQLLTVRSSSSSHQGRAGNIIHLVLTWHTRSCSVDQANWNGHFMARSTRHCCVIKQLSGGEEAEPEQDKWHHHSSYHTTMARYFTDHLHQSQVFFLSISFLLLHLIITFSINNTHNVCLSVCSWNFSLTTHTCRVCVC